VPPCHQIKLFQLLHIPSRTHDKISSISLQPKRYNSIFFWVPSYVGISGNERADCLAFSTNSHIFHFSLKLPAFDILLFHKLLRSAWQFNWDFLPPNFASWHRRIVSIIPMHSLFKDLDLSKRLIVSFSCLRIGHTYKLNLNSSPLCTRYQEQFICDFEHIIFNCPFLLSSRLLLFSLLSSLVYIAPESGLLNSCSTPIIHSIINFIHSAGFLI